MKKILFILLLLPALIFGQATGTVISNKASGGAIGTAAATVDVSTLFNLNQTTASQTLTVPNLTNAAAGKIIYINNIGSVSLTLSPGGLLLTGTGVVLRWTGSAWNVCGIGASASGITGLTTDFIPIATSATTLGDSYLSQDGTHVYIANSKTFSDGTGKSGLTFGTGVNTEIFWRDGLNTSKFHADSGQVYLSFSNFFGHSGQVLSNHANTYLSHSNKISFDAPLYNFTNQTSSEIAYFTPAGYLSTLAVATYPSLVELAYVKGVTSSIQAQLNAKISSQWTTTGSDIYYNTGNVLIGTNAAPTTVKFQTVETATTTLRGASFDQYNNGTQSSKVFSRKARGTYGTPLTIVTGDLLSNWTSSGHDGSNFIDAASIRITSAGTVATTRVPTKMEFQTATDAAPSVLTTALTLDESQNATFAGSVGLTGTRVSKGWFTDLEITNAPTIGGTSASGTGGLIRTTAPTFITRITAPEVDVSGTGGAGFINFVAQSSNAVAPAATGFNLFSGSTGGLAWARKNGSDTYIRMFDATLTADRTYTLPDASTTIVGIDVTQTLTNKRVTSRTGTTASSATPTINTDNVDYYSITALAAAITSFTTNLSGTPTTNQTLWIAITDNGTARAITWGASFEASGTLALPTTTVISTRLDVGFVWNEATSKWRICAVQ